MKKLILLLICLIFFTISYSQKELKIGDSVIKPILVDSSKFNLYGTWKVIYRTYVAERENTYEIIPLEELNQEYYKIRKAQGELIYGNYVYFDEKLYIPYCPYLPSLIINPLYKKMYIETNEARGYEPNIRNLKLLAISVLCPLYQNSKTQEEFGLLVISSDIICILDNNAYTYLKRVEDKIEAQNTWNKDESGFFYVNLLGSSDFLFYISNNEGKTLKVIYNKFDNCNFEYNYITNYISNNCNEGKTQKIFTTRNIQKIEYPLSINIDLQSLKSNTIKFSGGFEKEDCKWQIKWKIE